MLVLVTGGTGVVGRPTINELLRRQHRVRLLTRHAREDARQWPEGVEAWEGSVAEPATVAGSAEGCDAILHAAAIIAESPPETTFEAINVEGTRVLLREVERARVPRFVYISSLGAERGESPYHVSKRAGEKLVLGSVGNMTVVRLANVYGPGDQVISLLLKMIRMLPVIPAIDGGEDVFQPIWVGDVAAALAEAIERTDLDKRVLDVAGPDRTCMNDLIRRVRDITGRTPLTVPIPGGLAVLGARLASLAGVDIPLDRGQITMLEEGNVIANPRDNALTSVLGVPPTPLDVGLGKLADALPEQLPEEGVGRLKSKRVWADIRDSKFNAEALFERFRERFSEVTPWSMDVGAEPRTPAELRAGETMTMGLPLRGNVQVRVEELTPLSVTLVTLEGHPLAGAVRFLAMEQDGRVRFEVRVYDRAADVADWLVMRTVGQYIQLGTWRSIVRQVVKESGGEAVDGIQHQMKTLDDEDAARVEAWLRELVVRHKRESELP